MTWFREGLFINLYNPLTVESMWDSFNTAFEGNIEKLKITHPHLDYEEMVEKAAEITTSFFYFLERENLEHYRKPEFWSDMI